MLYVVWIACDVMLGAYSLSSSVSRRGLAYILHNSRAHLTPHTAQALASTMGKSRRFRGEKRDITVFGKSRYSDHIDNYFDEDEDEELTSAFGVDFLSRPFSYAKTASPPGTRQMGTMPMPMPVPMQVPMQVHMPAAVKKQQGKVSGANGANKKGKWTETMKPRNANQEKYIAMLEQPTPYIVISTGPAGTGKSSIAVSVAVQELLKQKYEKIVITRPAVSVNEEIGFLPGGLEEKMDPWMRPLYDTFYKYYTPDQVKMMIANKVIDICPIAYLRGRTLEDSFVIVDEAQNCTTTQMLMILTRIGANSKMVITGDPMQHDRGYGANGLSDLLTKLYKRKSHLQTAYKLNQRTDESYRSCENSSSANSENSENSANINNSNVEPSTENNTGNITGINTEITELSSRIHHIAFNEKDVERHPVIRNILSIYS